MRNACQPFPRNVNYIKGSSYCLNVILLSKNHPPRPQTPPPPLPSHPPRRARPGAGRLNLPVTLKCQKSGRTWREQPRAAVCAAVLQCALSGHFIRHTLLEPGERAVTTLQGRGCVRGWSSSYPGSFEFLLPLCGLPPV